MAHRTTLEEERPAKTPKAAKKFAAGGLAKVAGPSNASGSEERERIFDAFSRWGYFEAALDPLGLFEPLRHPDLDALIGETAEEARAIYCNTISADFMHLPEPDSPRWLADLLYATPSPVHHQQIIDPL